MAWRWKLGAFLVGIAVAENLLMIKIGEIYGTPDWAIWAAIGGALVAWYYLEKKKWLK